MIGGFTNILIILKKDIYKFNKFFYETISNYVSWDVRHGDTFLMERDLCTIFDSSFQIKNNFRNL
jgi:hypothetical protein